MPDFEKKEGEVFRKDNEEIVTPYGAVSMDGSGKLEEEPVQKKEKKKKEKISINKNELIASVIHLGGVLLAITFVAALALGFINGITKDKIAEHKKAAEADAMRSVISQADNFVKTDFKETKDVASIYEAKKGGELCGYAVKATPTGFAGDIELMIGFDQNKDIVGVKIVSMNETPGIGTKTQGDSFLSQFSQGAQWKTISGATISSSAVIRGVTAAKAALADTN